MTSSLLLPERTRLVHIGAPKSGSTALQNAARQLRPALRDNGVVYPGKAPNHQRQLSVLIDRPADAWGGELPPREWWDTAKAEIEADNSNRILMSFELVCQGDISKVQRVSDEIGPSLHAVLVLRNFGSLLPSMWQQKVKMGSSTRLERFVDAALSDPTAVKIDGSDAFHRDDGRNLIERWCEVIGPDRFTVVVLDPRQPSQLFDAFEGMLGLPDGLLSSAPGDGHQSNRSMSAVEVELFRQINHVVLNEWKADKLYHRQLVWMGAIDRVLANRTPGPDEGRIRLPISASERAQEAGTYLAEAIRSAGVQVVGRLDALTESVDAAPDGSLGLPEQLPADLTTEALLGIAARSVGADSFHTGELPPVPSRPLHHPTAS